MHGSVHVGRLGEGVIDDHVSANMRCSLLPTSFLVRFVVYLHNVFAINWAHGVVVSHPLRMRTALGSNPSVSMHMCMHDSHGSRDYLSAHSTHAYICCRICCMRTHTCIQTHSRSHQPVRCVCARPRKFLQPNGHGASSYGGGRDFEFRLDCILRLASILACWALAFVRLGTCSCCRGPGFELMQHPL